MTKNKDDFLRRDRRKKRRPRLMSWAERREKIGPMSCAERRKKIRPISCV
jgi:hypothetical protein